MRSVTKTKLSENQIIQLVKTHFGNDCEVGKICELNGGFFNTAYSVERLNLRDTIVLKVSVSKDTPILSYEKNTMGTEVEVLKLLTENTTVPIPRLLAYDFSLTLIPCPYFFMTMFKGTTMNNIRLSSQNREEIDRELADYFAQIHQTPDPRNPESNQDPEGIRGFLFG